MMPRETFNGQTVFFVVFLVKHVGVFGLEGQVFDEEFICRTIPISAVQLTISWNTH